MKRKLGVLLFWLLGLFLFWWYAQSQGMGPRAFLESALSLLTENPWGPLLLFACYLVRPLLLVPVTLLTLASGFLFGPVWGLIYAFLAMLLSSALAYGIGYFMGAEAPFVSQTSATRFITALRENSFETVLTGRFLFMPGDLLNYSAGFLRMNLVAFLLASAIGGAPGLFIGVLAGASVEGSLHQAGVSINAQYLLLSTLLFAFSLAGAYLLKKRKRVEVYK